MLTGFFYLYTPTSLAEGGLFSPYQGEI